VHNIIKTSAAVHALSCSQRLDHVKNNTAVASAGSNETETCARHAPVRNSPPLIMTLNAWSRRRQHCLTSQ